MCAYGAVAQSRINGIEGGYSLFSMRRLVFNGGIESQYTGNGFGAITQKWHLDSTQSKFAQYNVGYARKGAKIVEGEEVVFSRAHYLTMATLVGKDVERFEFLFGPEFAYLLSANSIKDDIKYSSVSAISSRVDVSLLVSLGFRWQERAVFGARISQGLITVQQLLIVDRNGNPTGTVGTFNRGLQFFARYHFVQ